MSADSATAILSPPSGPRPPCIFRAKWSDLTGGRWDPNYYRHMRTFLAKIRTSPFSVEKLRDSVELVQYGISERATEEVVGTPMLRMINLQDASWDLSDLKYIEMDDAEKKPYLLYEGDLLFNRTNSKELVGKCNVFDIPGEYVFASYLIRVRLNLEKLLPGYVTAYLSSSLGRIQIDAVSRQIAGMTNVNAEEIRDLLIPMPGLDVQQEIAKKWKDALRHRDETVIASRRLLASIDDLLLAELGITLPPEPENSITSRIFTRPAAAVTGGRWDPFARQPKLMNLYRAIEKSSSSVFKLKELIVQANVVVSEIPDGLDYVGLENIDGATGEITFNREKESVSTALRFHPGQIIFPKLRPYLNKTALATTEGVCSTEFHVFNAVDVLPVYLAAFLRSSFIVKITSRLMTGNTLPRLQLDDILALPIPVPPEKEQRRICEEIAARQRQARELTATAQAALERAKREIEAMILGGDTAK